MKGGASSSLLASLHFLKPSARTYQYHIEITALISPLAWRIQSETIRSVFLSFPRIPTPGEPVKSTEDTAATHFPQVRRIATSARPASRPPRPATYLSLACLASLRETYPP